MPYPAGAVAAQQAQGQNVEQQKHCAIHLHRNHEADSAGEYHGWNIVVAAGIWGLRAWLRRKRPAWPLCRHSNTTLLGIPRSSSASSKRGSDCIFKAGKPQNCRRRNTGSLTVTTALRSLKPRSCWRGDDLDRSCAHTPMCVNRQSGRSFCCRRCMSVSLLHCTRFANLTKPQQMSANASHLSAAHAGSRQQRCAPAARRRR